MSIHLPNGIAETLGDSLVTASPLFTSKRLWYVNSATGVDDPAYGDSKAKPYATVAYALAGGAVSGDIIVVADGHTEVVATTIEVIISVVIVGCGQTDGKPTVKFTKTTGATYIFQLTADGVELRNLWFEPNTVSSASSQVFAPGSECRIIGCYFEADELSGGTSLQVANDAANVTFVKDCTFVAVATDVTDLPPSAMTMGLGTLYMDNCVFDDGDLGYGTAAFVGSGAARIRGEGNSFLNGAVFQGDEAGDIILAGGSFTGGVQLVEV